MKKEKNLNEEGYEPEILDTEVEATSEAGLNFAKYKNLMIIAVVAIVIIGVVWFLRYKSEQDSSRASVLLSRVMPLIESAEYQKALDGDPQMKYRGESVKGLIQIVNEFEGTDQGKLAALHAANAYLSLGKHKEAAKYFDIATGSPAKLIQSGANAGKGACLELEGKYKEAAEMYEKASTLSEEDNVKARYLTYTGLCFEKVKDNANAEKYFRQVVDFFGNTEFANTAKSGLVRIGTKIE